METYDHILPKNNLANVFFHSYLDAKFSKIMIAQGVISTTEA